MRTLIKFFKDIILFIKNDPVKKCTFHIERKCTHVDSYECTFPQCDLLDTYLKEKAS